MFRSLTRSIATACAVCVLFAGGGVALAAHGHHAGRAHRADAGGLAQQCVSAKAAGSSSAAAACEAANNAANPPLTPAQESRLQTLSRECRAAKAAEANGQPADTSACAEANALASGS
jgi:hypothetical protein